jgi:predicted nucleotidyltransferase
VTERFSLPATFSEELRKAVTSIFVDELVFAFVFGSFAKGFGKRGHDIDTFVCVKRFNAAKERVYRAWLRDIHARYGCIVDERYPHEIVEHARLCQIERDVRSLVLAFDENDADLFDVVTWVQVLTDAKTCVVGSTSEVMRFEVSFAGVPETWKARALAREPWLDAALPPLYFIKHVYRFKERLT